MPDSYERLSAQDQSFLLFEHDTTPMHVGAVAVFEGGGLIGEDGGLDLQRLVKNLEARLPLLPRYRQRLDATPLERHPIWVDDEHFDLAYHLRHTALPRPGSEQQLQALAGRVLSQSLDRRRPLWEMWAVEGLEGGRFALITKIHHCMVDGASGVNIMTALFSPQPEGEPPAAPGWSPRHQPSPVDLVIEDGLRGLRVPFELLRNAVAALRDPRAALGALGRQGRAVAQALESGLHLAAPTPLNRPIGSHRRVEWCSLPLDEVKHVKNALGATVNDVILTVAAGALRRFLRGRHVAVDELDYRVVVPVNMRPPGDDGSAANHVSALLFSLPLDEPDPLRRAARIAEETARLKRSDAALGTELLMGFADWSGGTLLTLLGVRLISRIHPYNLIITNVPGPQFPLYLLGARLLAMYPQLPLFDEQGLGLAVMSYAGQVHWGLIADRDLVPDLGELASGLGDAFAELRDAALAP